MITNATETVISTADTPVLVAGTWSEDQATQFTTTAAGRITYDGVNDITLPVDVSFRATVASGTNKEISFYLYKNGTVQNNSQVTATVDAADTKNQSITHQITFSNGDYIEMFAENNTDTTNIIVDRAHFRVN